MAAPSEALRATLAGRYEIERELGQGGMATVYLARDVRHHRRVAIKVLKPKVAASLGGERFLREIDTAASLTHPNILPLHDSGEVGGFLYYVMPYVDGESLRTRLEREKQLPLDEALRIAREVADALNCAHSHGVVHRDVKPANILLESGHAVVADFGIARAISSASGEALNRVPSEAELGTLGSASAQRAALMLVERDAGGLLQMPEVRRATIFDGQDFFLPSTLYAGWAHQLRGENAAARAAFDVARARTDAVMRELPDDCRVHAARGLALAGLGRRQEALDEALWLERSEVYRLDAFQGTAAAEDRARILARIGDTVAALDEIERLLARPSWLSVHTLRLDPRWDPIRNHPRFKELLEKYGSGP